jgi:hypothetical protein
MDSHDHGARESEDVRHHTTHEHAHIEAGREESNPEVFDLEKVAGQQPLKRKKVKRKKRNKRSSVTPIDSTHAEGHHASADTMRPDQERLPSPRTPRISPRTPRTPPGDSPAHARGQRHGEGNATSHHHHRRTAQDAHHNGDKDARGGHDHHHHAKETSESGNKKKLKRKKVKRKKLKRR